MKEIKIGTIGTGSIVRAILDGVMVTEGLSLEAVYSRTMERGRALAADYHCSKVYTDLDAFLDDNSLDFIYIASPNDLHYSYAKKALLAGRHVLCEKPCTPERGQAQELLDLARQKGLWFVDATPTAFLPNLKVLKDHLDEIGRIKLVMGNFSQYSSRYDLYRQGEIPNVFSLDHAGGALMDINYYNVYLTIALFGKPDQAVYMPNKGFNGVDTSGLMTLSYPGFVSSLIGAKDCRGENFYQIEGEDGYIYVKGSASTLPEIRVVTRDKDMTYNEQTNPVIWFHEVENIAKMLLTEDRETLETGHQVMLDTIEVMEKSRKASGILF